jgi:four helix bundle protein
MDATELKERTKAFGLRVLGLVDALPETRRGRIVAGQLGRAGTSVGANYRAACRARSKAEFVSKIGTVIEEADESAFWIEIVADGRILPRKQVVGLLQEANELVAIMTSSRMTAEGNLAMSRRMPAAAGTHVNRQSTNANRQSPTGNRQ